MNAQAQLGAIVRPQPRGSVAVMARRVEPPDSLDFFPTPPWATRALCEHVLRQNVVITTLLSAWDPAAGEGHMTEVLKEYFASVRASDVFDYGAGYGVGSFVGKGLDVIAAAPGADWIVTNPPFNLALAFATRAIELARHGVALLVRSNWAETADRYRCLFKDRPPSIIAQFVERVPMTKGRWNPDASTATAYAWFIWMRDASPSTRFVWIAPGCCDKLTKLDDRARFAAWSIAERSAIGTLPLGTP